MSGRMRVEVAMRVGGGDGPIQLISRARLGVVGMSSAVGYLVRKLDASEGLVLLQDRLSVLPPLKEASACVFDARNRAIGRTFAFSRAVQQRRCLRASA